MKKKIALFNLNDIFNKTASHWVFFSFQQNKTFPSFNSHAKNSDCPKTLLTAHYDDTNNDSSNFSFFFKPQNVPALQTAAKFSHVCMHAPWMELPDSLLQNGSMPPSWLFGIETSRVNEGSHLICLQSERLTSHN